MRAFILLCVVGFAACQYAADLDVILDAVVADTNIDGDDEISLEEFREELLLQFDADGDEKVKKDEFITLFCAKYHDHPEDVETFFDNLDALPDGTLSEVDLLLQMGDLSPDGNLIITIQEFRDFIHLCHPY